MKNITLKIDDDTYRKARVRAAERGTSVSAIVRTFLESLNEETETSEQQKRIISALEEIYAEADARATPRSETLIPLTREEIYAERLR